MGGEPAEEEDDDVGPAFDALLKAIGSGVFDEAKLISLPTEERDLALGRFMHEWSELEASLRFLLQMLMKTPLLVAVPVASAIPDLGRLRELLLALGGLQLEKEADIKELQAICVYLEICTKYRNSIVHGQWHTCLLPVDGTSGESRPQWVRVYNIIGLSQQVAAVLGWNAGAKEKFVFTVARLDERAKKAREFAKRVHSFSQSIGTVQW